MLCIKLFKLNQAARRLLSLVQEPKSAGNWKLEIKLLAQEATENTCTQTTGTRTEASRKLTVKTFEFGHGNNFL